MPEEEQAEQANTEDVKEEVSAEVETVSAESSTVEADESSADAQAVEGSEVQDEPDSEPNYKELFEAEKKRRIAERTRLKTRLRETQNSDNQVEGKQGQEQSQSNPEEDIDASKFDYDPVKIAREVAKRELQAERAKLEADERRKSADRLISDFDQKSGEYAAANPEYDKLLSEKDTGYEDADIEKAVLKTGAELDHYLLANEAEVDRIKAISDRDDKLLAIGELRAKSTQWAAKSKKGVTKKITNAPAPSKAVAGGGNGRVPKDWRYDESLTPEEYNERMLAED